MKKGVGWCVVPGAAEGGKGKGRIRGGGKSKARIGEVEGAPITYFLTLLYFPRSVLAREHPQLATKAEAKAFLFY